MYKCKICGEEFKVKQALGGHVTSNHISKEKIEKRKENSRKSLFLKRIKIKKICPKCKKEFEVEERIKRNGKISNDSRKFCSDKCSKSRIFTEEMKENLRKKMKGKVSYNKGKKLSIEQKNKISKSVKKTLKDHPEIRKRISNLLKGRKVSKETRKKLSQALKGKTGGYRIRSARSKFHGGWYKDVWFDSSWELHCVKLLDKYEIEWDRNKIYLIWIDDEEISHKYYPDFYLSKFDTYLEIKGYWTDDNKYKMSKVEENNKDKTIIYLESLKQIDDFVKNLEGKQNERNIFKMY